MKKLILLLGVFISVNIYAQRLSLLPTATTYLPVDYLVLEPLSPSTPTSKIAISNFYKNVSITDSFNVTGESIFDDTVRITKPMYIYGNLFNGTGVGSTAAGVSGDLQINSSGLFGVTSDLNANFNINYNGDTLKFGNLTTNYMYYDYKRIGLKNALNNIYFGENTGLNITTGGNNIFIGKNAGLTNASGNYNVYIGNLSGVVSTSSDNVFVGYNTGNLNTSGSSNTFIGSNAGRVNVTGAQNVFLGQRSGNNNTASSNTFIGYYSGYSTTSGANNVFLGNTSGYSNVTGTRNIYIGYQAGYNETGSNKLYIESSSSSTPLIYGDFSTNYLKFNTDSVRITGDTYIENNLTVQDTAKIEFIKNNELWLYADTTHVVGRLEVDSNLYVDGHSVLSKYEVAAYTDPDSTVTTSATTDWTYVGAGLPNKFSTIYIEGFSYDGDTLVFNQDADDMRDSVEFNFSGTVESATSTVNKTVYHTLFIKSVGGAYREIRHLTTKTRTATAGVYYPGPVCTTMPVYLKDGDKIQIRCKIAVSTTTLSSQGYKVYLREQ